MTEIDPFASLGRKTLLTTNNIAKSKHPILQKMHRFYMEERSMPKIDKQKYLLTQHDLGRLYTSNS